MITQDDINSVLGVACARLGYVVTNAALYREVVPEDVTDEMLAAECAAVRAEASPELSPIEAAESHIARHFSTAKLLQMKVWWDAIPHGLTPMLGASYAWVAGVTAAAVGGVSVFDDPPFSFSQIAQECVAAMTGGQP